MVWPIISTLLLLLTKSVTQSTLQLLPGCCIVWCAGVRSTLSGSGIMSLLFGRNRATPHLYDPTVYPAPCLTEFACVSLAGVRAALSAGSIMSLLLGRNIAMLTAGEALNGLSD